jgi:hypothetical protein
MRWPGHKFAFAVFAAVLILWLGAMVVLMRHSALPDEATGKMLVIFDTGTTEDEAIRAITAAGANPIRISDFSFIWIAQSDAPGTAGKLKQQGALGAYRELPLSPVIAGCVAVVDRKVAKSLDQ